MFEGGWTSEYCSGSRACQSNAGGGAGVEISGLVVDNGVMRRILLAEVRSGDVVLGDGEGHHVRDVLRLGPGERVEVFDESGRTADGEIVRADAKQVVVRVGEVGVGEVGLRWTVAAAVPKGSRADWMIEKLSELGTAVFVPLAAERSVVLPEGEGKRARWNRIAAEAAKQSRRVGVMAIGELTRVEEYVAGIQEAGWYLTTEEGAVEVEEAARRMAVGENDECRVRSEGSEAGAPSLSLLVGPEGGWTEQELEGFRKAGLTGVRLGRTILRVETAAVAAAVIAAAVVAPAVRRGGN